MASTWITAREAAARLGVKPETLYAYVSRGLLRPERAVDGRTSRYRAADVDELARRGRPGGRPARAGNIDVRITTSLTELTPDGPRYRGVPVVPMAGTVAFEQVAEWLWTGDDAAFGPVGAAAWAPRLPHATGRPHASLDLLLARCVAAAQADRDRADRRPEAVRAAARHLVGDLVAALPASGRPMRAPDVASALFVRLAGRRPDEAERAALDGALVLLADHDMAASTLAARVAASTRADVYHVVLAGLATVSGPLHGLASTLAYRLVTEAAERGDARAVIDDRLRMGERLPGFGHRIYTATDPRFTALVALVRAASPDAARLDVVDALTEAAAARIGTFANIDLALAALAWSCGLAPTSGECLFAVARVAGWVAHALEEYGERPLRYRPQAAYVGGRSSAPPARS
jgi:citrate synthase